jgi:hypothetical protein
VTAPRFIHASGHSRLSWWLDGTTEAIIYGMVIFSPWAFGTTQPWSMGWMNAAGYLLGAMWICKVLLRRRAVVGDVACAPGAMIGRWLLVFTLAILAYIFVSALNAEFVYVPAEWRQEPKPHLDWLPHSLDRNATWNLFWNWLALACVFWAVTDWLSNDLAPDGRARGRRWRRLVFVLAANGALVALEGIIQRNSGTAKLLWIMPTRDNPNAAAQFGPYAYRANAAQFFNLIWPAALAVWWQRQFQAERRTQTHHWLLPSVMLLMAGSLVSLSRGGVAVTLLQLGACGMLFLFGGKFGLGAKLGILAMAVMTVGAATYLGWEQLAPRLRDAGGDLLSGRAETYRLAERMTDDYPWFGVGPGAFGSVFQFYRNSPADYWPGQLHNDWLELLITFGRIGCALLLAALSLVMTRWLSPGGLRTSGAVAALVWIALGGCLLHARFDFPLQIYSIQFVFVLLCAALFTFSRSGNTTPG